MRIRFEDDGPGMPPEVLERLFIPFYTTKPSGTGLGLAICQRIVKSLDGTIEVSSRFGRGHDVLDLPAGDRRDRACPTVAVSNDRPSDRNGQRRNVRWGETRYVGTGTSAR